MQLREAYVYLLDKVNKLNTNFGKSLDIAAACRAINEAQTYWYDLRLKSMELDKNIQRELQSLLRTQVLEVSDINDRYTKFYLPKDYYTSSKLQIQGKSSKGDCSLFLDGFLTENSNTEQLYINDVTSPDLSWQQTFYTFNNNSIVVYKKNFEVSVVLDYYKQLSKVEVRDTEDASRDINLDLDGSSAYEILNIAAAIITGNTQDPTYQVHLNNAKNFV